MANRIKNILYKIQDKKLVKSSYMIGNKVFHIQSLFIGDKDFSEAISELIHNRLK